LYFIVHRIILGGERKKERETEVEIIVKEQVK
jgi:hypothetical protein